ncbi:MAG: ABATE domain-containing protein, partial [Rhodoglobus sp.]|nr:ABATE domain-containing protein [Rhodoglobus sp.]
MALGNTHPTASKSGADELATIAELYAILEAHTYSGRLDRDTRELAEVRETRDHLRRVWSLERDAATKEVNRMLADAGALP